ncbi:MAG TPA: TolC family protein [Saprospiraceae bacterium]|nr:TolC family protein [Saprospiraceae bacterium]HND88807.1 TolC family protein [Saprospiraceae bacterium]
MRNNTSPAQKRLKPSAPLRVRHLLWLLLCFPCALHAQSTAPFDWPAARQQVLANHPLSRQADLYRDQADAALLRARGGFDPKAYADHHAKNFSGSTYFRYTEAGVKWPSWLGLEFKGAYNWASGAYLSSESKLPKDGQATFGFNWSLGQGLLMDERRAALRQARVSAQQAQAERDLARNELLLDAAKAYWTWALADNSFRVFEDARQQASIRNDAVREGFLQGERAAVDTLETFIQVQSRLLDVNFARVDRQNSGIGLSNFLWTADQQQLLPADLAAAPSLAAADYSATVGQQVENWVSEARAQHPALRYYSAKLQMLEVERRLKLEKRKPVLDLNYNFLGNGWTFFPTATADGVGVLANDIKWGLQFSYPLLNRKARGELQISDIKIAQTELELRQKRQDIEMKVRQYANDLSVLGQQIGLYADIVSKRRALLDAENARFGLGESSVFLVNTREQSWLDAQVKYLKLLSEYRKAEAGLRWARGVLE